MENVRVQVPVMKNGKPVMENGKPVMKIGELVEVVEQKEPWSEYRLKDGTVVRTKQTMMQIVKMMDTDKPTYSFQAQSVISVIPPISEDSE